ncbi:G5 domain-containing protein [Aerococcus viridans]
MSLNNRNKSGSTGRKILHKVKGQWVAALVVAGTLGGVLLSNDTVQANVNSVATQVMQNVASSDYESKTDLLTDEKILDESSQALANITSGWEKNTVDEVRAEIERQREAGLDAYVVQWGDTLSVLAEATNKSVEDLANANNIGNWHLILTGDILQNVLTDSQVTDNQSENVTSEQTEEAAIEVSAGDDSSVVETGAKSATNNKTDVNNTEETVSESEKDPSDANLDQEVIETEETIDEPTEEPEEDTTDEATEESVDVPVEEPQEDSTDESVEEPTEETVEDETEAPEREPSEESSEETVENYTEQESISHEVTYQENNELVQGENKVIQNGVDGIKEVTYDGQTDEVISESIIQEPVTEIIEVGTMTSETRTEKVQEEVPFKTELIENTELESATEQVVQEGQPGSKELTYEVTYVNGEETGRELISEELVTAPINRIIEVGTAEESEPEFVTETRREVVQEEIPFETEHRENSNLTSGTEQIVQEGQTGTKKFTYDVTYENGDEVGRELVSEEVVTEPIIRIVEVGTQELVTETDTVTEAIPFETICQDNPDLPVGTEEVVQEGQDGSSVTTFNVTYENGQEVSREQVGEASITQPINQIVEVGTQETEETPREPTGGNVDSVKYGVESGDTLNSIAQEFGTSAEAIAQASGISVNTGLYVGQTLIIPNASLDQMANEQANDGRSIVMLDAGHGGWESGATSNGASEEDMNLNLAQKLTGELNNRGYEVINTREDDTTVSLGDRSSEANASNADIFISLHHNALNGDAEGIETFYYEYTVGYEPSQNIEDHNDGQRLANSAYLAELIQAELIAGTDAVDRGVKTDTFSVLRETDVPAVLVEFGFIDNDSERAQLLNAEYQDIMISAVANAVETYFATVGY